MDTNMWPLATPVKGAPPRGRAAIVEAALDAAERLFATASPRDVSLRQIAAEAGVTYSLLNRHLGTKDDLLEALLARFEARWAAGTGADADLASVAARLLGTQPDPGLYLRLLAWSVLGDPDDAAALAHRRHALLHELVPLARAGGFDGAAADDRVAAVLALVFGWRFFGGFILDALHTGDDARARVQAAVTALVAELTAPP